MGGEFGQGKRCEAEATSGSRVEVVRLHCVWNVILAMVSEACKVPAVAGEETEYKTQKVICSGMTSSFTSSKLRVKSNRQPGPSGSLLAQGKMSIGYFQAEMLAAADLCYAVAILS